MRAYKFLTCALPLAAVSMAGAQDIQATVNGRLVDFEGTQPMMMGGRVVVPLRGVFEEMGAFVHWDPLSRMVHAEGNGREVMLRINERFAQVNGSRVALDTPATLVRGRTMVPLRFVSESLGANVDWIASTRTVAITTGEVAEYDPPRYDAPTPAISISRNTVLPVRLQTELSSATSKVGDRFTAVVDTRGEDEYAGLPIGTRIEGHVDAVHPKTSDTPGVLGLEFDRLLLPTGRAVAIDGSPIKLDSNNVETRDGRLVAKAGAGDRDLKWVGYGAGAGALIAIATRGNVLTSALIGAALGYILGETQRPQEYREVRLDRGLEFGVRLDQDLVVR